MVFIQYIFGVGSIRKTVQEIEVNVAYRWFLGYGLSDKIPPMEGLKTVTKSTTDPESGIFVKGEHERCFHILRIQHVIKITL